MGLNRILSGKCQFKAFANGNKHGVDTFKCTVILTFWWVFLRGIITIHLSLSGVFAALKNLRKRITVAKTV